MRRRIIWSDEPKIGPALKKLREESGLTTRALAAKLSCTHSRVVKIENGTQRIALDEFIVWCNAIGSAPIDALTRVIEET